MSMKKTDLEKHLAKKLDGKLRSGNTPQRFGQGAKAIAAKAEAKPKDTPLKLVCHKKHAEAPSTPSSARS